MQSRSFLNRFFVIFTSFSFVIHLSLKQFINSFIFFPSFHEKKKSKKKKKKKTVEESSGPVQLSKVCCSSLDQVKLYNTSAIWSH